MPLLKRIEVRTPHGAADSAMAVDRIYCVLVRFGPQSNVFLYQKRTNVVNGVTPLSLEVAASAPCSHSISISFDVRQCRLPRPMVWIRAFPDRKTFRERHTFTEAKSSSLTRKFVCFSFVTSEQVLELKGHYGGAFQTEILLPSIRRERKITSCLNSASMGCAQLPTTLTSRGWCSPTWWRSSSCRR